MGIIIRFRVITANYRSWYIGYLTQERKKGEINNVVRESKHEATFKGTHKKIQTTHKKNQEEIQSSTQENCFLRLSQNWRWHSNHILTQDIGNYTWQKFLNTLIRQLIHSQNDKNTHTMKGQHYASNLCADTATIEPDVGSSMPPGWIYQEKTRHNWPYSWNHQ